MGIGGRTSGNRRWRGRGDGQGGRRGGRRGGRGGGGGEGRREGNCLPAADQLIQRFVHGALLCMLVVCISL